MEKEAQILFEWQCCLKGKKIQIFVEERGAQMFFQKILLILNYFDHFGARSSCPERKRFLL
jgi:hypothetical protein